MNTPPPPLAPLVDETMNALYHYFNNPNNPQTFSNDANGDNSIMNSSCSSIVNSSSNNYQIFTNGTNTSSTILSNQSQSGNMFTLPCQYGMNEHNSSNNNSVINHQLNLEEKRSCKIIFIKYI